MYKNNRGTFLPGNYRINGTDHVFTITKRARYSCDCKGAIQKYNYVSTGMRIFYNAECDDHYIEIAIQDGGARRCYWRHMDRRGN